MTGSRWALKMSLMVAGLLALLVFGLLTILLWPSNILLWKSANWRMVVGFGLFVPLFGTGLAIRARPKIKINGPGCLHLHKEEAKIATGEVAGWVCLDCGETVPNKKYTEYTSPGWLFLRDQHHERAQRWGDGCTCDVCRRRVLKHSYESAPVRGCGCRCCQART